MLDISEILKKFPGLSDTMSSDDLDLAGFTKGVSIRVNLQDDRIIIRRDDSIDENKPVTVKPFTIDQNKKIKEIIVKETRTKITFYHHMIVIEKPN